MGDLGATHSVGAQERATSEVLETGGAQRNLLLGEGRMRLAHVAPRSSAVASGLALLCALEEGRSVGGTQRCIARCGASQTR